MECMSCAGAGVSSHWIWSAMIWRVPEVTLDMPPVGIHLKQEDVVVVVNHLLPLSFFLQCLRIDSSPA